jgi:aldehyde dehydrogenase (NAD+)
VFGPVVAITRFATDEEAIAIANSTRYGLSSYIQTNDVTRALRIAAELKAGEVLINGAHNLAVHRPFGGLGISGVGKEGGRAGFEEFLQIKTVAIAVRQKTKAARSDARTFASTDGTSERVGFTRNPASMTPISNTN